MNRILKIGTRESPLAMWQAERVQSLLNNLSMQTALFPVSSKGDHDLVTPLYAMGVQGVFTRHLDAHLLQGDIDIAVHSMKDVPTQLAKGLVQVAVLPRASYMDLLVLAKGKWENTGDGKWNKLEKEIPYFIGTGSVRRKAQWMHKFPHSHLENLRGNVQTRLRKIAENNWDGAIFAQAGLERMGLLQNEYITLDWMLPAPAQGAIMVVAREQDVETITALQAINDEATATCVKIERDFLTALMGGCSTPIGAHAQVVGDKIVFKGNILSPDGSKKLQVEKEFELENAVQIGTIAADILLAQGAGAIIEEIRKFEKEH